MNNFVEDEVFNLHVKYIGEANLVKPINARLFDRRHHDRRLKNTIGVEKYLFNNDSNPILKISEEFSAWEDELYFLGSEISHQDLARMLLKAPDKSASLYRFASCIYVERLQESMIEWEDQLDALGPFPDINDLERLINEAPDKKHALVIFASGVLSQRILFA